MYNLNMNVVLLIINGLKLNDQITHFGRLTYVQIVLFGHVSTIPIGIRGVPGGYQCSEG